MPNPVGSRFRDWARRIKRELVVVYWAARDPRTPWTARVVAGLVVAYALSPIDLIPDFVPVLGYLDDAVIVPLGLFLALRLIPAAVLAEHRARVDAGTRLPSSRGAALAIVAAWIALAGAVAGWIFLR